jgi:hypothetical protein
MCNKSSHVLWCEMGCSLTCLLGRSPSSGNREEKKKMQVQMVRYGKQTAAEVSESRKVCRDMSQVDDLRAVWYSCRGYWWIL